MITWFLLSAQCLSYPGNTAVAENALEFKTLADAMRIRNHVIDVFERADQSLTRSAAEHCLRSWLPVAAFQGRNWWVKRFRTRYHRRLSKSLHRRFAHRTRPFRRKNSTRVE